MTTVRTTWSAVAVTTLLGLTLLPAGCRRHGEIDRLPVHGTVKTAGGEKLTASIVFMPSGGRQSPSATASVVNGEYHFDRANGPTAGPAKVAIRRLISRQAQMDSLRNKVAKPPAKSEWILSADVPDDGHYVQDFILAD